MYPLISAYLVPGFSTWILEDLNSDPHVLTHQALPTESPHQPLPKDILRGTLEIVRTLGFGTWDLSTPAHERYCSSGPRVEGSPGTPEALGSSLVFHSHVQGAHLYPQHSRRWGQEDQASEVILVYLEFKTSLGFRVEKLFPIQLCFSLAHTQVRPLASWEEPAAHGEHGTQEPEGHSLGHRAQRPAEFPLSDAEARGLSPPIPTQSWARPVLRWLKHTQPQAEASGVICSLQEMAVRGLAAAAKAMGACAARRCHVLPWDCHTVRVIERSLCWWRPQLTSEAGDL